MFKKVLAVIVGYLVMFAFVFITFTVAYLILGTEGSFQPGTYEISAAWIIVSILLSIVAAILGGWVAMAIAKNRKVALALAGVVIVLGFVTAIPMLSGTDDRPLMRESDVGSMEAMQYARQPTWMLILNPFLGAFGVLIGARMYRGRVEGAPAEEAPSPAESA